MMLVGNKYEMGLYHMREGSNSVEEDFVGGRSFQKSGTYPSNIM
jgi:hypothetical protein